MTPTTTSRAGLVPALAAFTVGVLVLAALGLDALVALAGWVAS